MRSAPLLTTLNGETPCGGSVYTVFGGLTAVILTDVAQSVIMLIGCVVILAAGLQAVGGIEAIARRTSQPRRTRHGCTRGCSGSKATGALRCLDLRQELVGAT